MYALVVLMFTALFLGVEGIYPSDFVFLPSLNQTYRLQDEVFVFELVPQFLVPHRLQRHTIYTASTKSTKRAIKRALTNLAHQNIELGNEDYQLLDDILEEVPENIKVNSKKRTVSQVLHDDVTVLRITPEVAIFSSYPSSKKRAVNQQQGTKLCLHIPFLTTCDNKADLEKVKKALEASVDSIHTELDSYKKTDDARANALAVALGKQKEAIAGMLAQFTDVAYMTGTVSRAVELNAAQTADGDFQALAQINFLKRTVNSLLKYSNAMASTDPRAVTAQPSLTKLFEGFQDAIASFTANNSFPILNYTDTFNWTETLLPAAAVKNEVVNPCADAKTCYLGAPNLVAFNAVIKYNCKESSLASPFCPTPLVAEYQWIYGPFHKAHHGIYRILVPPTGPSVEANIMRPVVQPNGNSIARSVSYTSSYCVQFLGYKMLASFANTTSLVNGIPTTVKVSDSDCNVYRLYNYPAGGKRIYSLYAESEGVIIPFYSNCNITYLNSTIPTPHPPLFSTVNYLCSNAWADGTVSTACGIVPEYFDNVDTYSYHYVSPTCYINLDPKWIDLDYYIPSSTVNLPDVPKGFKLEQFTINLHGELASSLQFLYTDKWINVYSIEKISDNVIIPDEIFLLNHDLVVFHLYQNMIVDESDSFFGQGNNGRDCVRKDNFNYNLFNCFYQNSNKYYTADTYLSGLTTTTGIARFVNKFNFSLSDDGTGKYNFTLQAKNEADFSFSVSMDGSLCPRTTDLLVLTDVCQVQLFYMGTRVVQLVPSNGSSVTVTFTNRTASVIVNPDTWDVKVGDSVCYGFTCTKTSTFSTVKLITPKMEIVSAADLALESKVSFTVAKTIGETVSSMETVQKGIDAAVLNLTGLRDKLDSINFNITELFPFENFTLYRKKIKDLIADINNISEVNAALAKSGGCTGPWSSAACWFQDFGSTLIVIVIVMVVVAVTYFALVKTGTWDKMFKGGEKKEEEQEMKKEVSEFQS